MVVGFPLSSSLDQGKEANVCNVLAETEAVVDCLPSNYTLVTQREPGNQVRVLAVCETLPGPKCP